MKNFIYCGALEGGMEEFFFDEGLEFLTYLLGWMKVNNVESDTKLLQWIEKAEIGECCSHRLGIVVRLKDRE